MARPLVSCDGSPRGVPFSGARPAAFHDFDSPLHVAQRTLKMSNPGRRHLLSVLAALPNRRIRRREPRPPRARPPTMIVWPFSSPYAPRRSFASSSMAVVPPAAIPLPSRLPRRDNQMTEIRMRRALGRSWGRRVVGRCGMRWPGAGRVRRRAVRPTARSPRPSLPWADNERLELPWCRAVRGLGAAQVVAGDGHVRARVRALLAARRTPAQAHPHVPCRV